MRVYVYFLCVYLIFHMHEYINIIMTHKDANSYIQIYTSSSSFRAASPDVPESLWSPVSIVHRSQKFF